MYRASLLAHIVQTTLRVKLPREQRYLPPAKLVGVSVLMLTEVGADCKFTAGALGRSVYAGAAAQQVHTSPNSCEQR